MGWQHIGAAWGALCVALAGCTPAPPPSTTTTTVTPTPSATARTPLTADELRDRVGVSESVTLHGSLTQPELTGRFDLPPTTTRLVVALSCSSVRPDLEVEVSVEVVQGTTPLTTLGATCGNNADGVFASMEPALFQAGGGPVVLTVEADTEPSLRYTVAVLGNP